MPTDSPTGAGSSRAARRRSSRHSAPGPLRPLALFAGALDVLVGQDTLVRVAGGAAGAKAERVHVRRRLLAAVVEDLLRVVLPCLLDGHRVRDDVVCEIQGKVVRLLVMTARRDLTRSA